MAPFDPSVVSNEPAFTPPWMLRSSMAQTMLAGTSLRKRGHSPMEEMARPVTLHCGDGIRTTGRLSTHPNGKGTVIILHGWLGSVDSTYVIASGRFLYDQGYSILRVNLLDHGDSLVLNPGVFHAAHFDEMFRAISEAVAIAPHQPVSLLGYSLGGNFALRVAREMRQTPLPRLEQIFAISPVIDPAVAGVMIDQSPMIRRYFRKKLHHTFRTKQDAYPDLYDMRGMFDIPSIGGITDEFLTRWSDFPSTDAYFGAYAIGADDLLGTPARVLAICSADDPIVPGRALDALARDGNIDCIVTDHGGHNGFFQSLLGPTYYDTLILNRLTR